MLIGRTEEQLQLLDTTRKLMAEIATEREVRRLMATPDGHDVAAWNRIRELGLPGLAVPGERGGAGGTLVDQGVVLEQMGRSLYCGPYFSTAVLAVQTLLHVERSTVGEELLAQVCDGELRGTLAVTEESGRWDEAGIRLRAEPGQGCWQLTGSKSYVLDGASADIILVVARTESGLSLFAVAANAEGLRRSPLPTMDQTRKQARLDFSSTPAMLLGVDGDGWRPVERGLAAAAVALAAEQVGGAEMVLEMSVDHARTRFQFGRPIGSFQAVQHKCATMLMEVEAAKSAAYYGLAAAVRQSPELPAVASLAKAFCSETYRRTANEAIQIFGGIALTWEHPLHLYFKRARSSQLLLGSAAAHRARLAAHLGLNPGAPAQPHPAGRPSD